MSDLLSLKNIDSVFAKWLNQIGIFDRKELEKIGAVKAYHEISLTQQNCNLNLLYALEGALSDLDWKDVPEGIKELLVNELRLL